MRRIEVGPSRGGGQGGCVRGIEVIVKMQKGRGWGSSRGSGWGGQGRCVRRIEAIVKMQKKSEGGRG